MLGCYNSFNKEISLMAVLGIPSSSEVSLIFLSAKNSFVVFSLEFFIILKKNKNLLKKKFLKKKTSGLIYNTIGSLSELI